MTMTVFHSPPVAIAAHQDQIPPSPPAKPLSAYNIFFQLFRQRILDGTSHLQYPVSHQEVLMTLWRHKNKPAKRVHRKTHGKISFRELSLTIAGRWKHLDHQSTRVLQEHAKELKRDYKNAVKLYKAALVKNKKSQSETESLASGVSSCSNQHPSLMANLALSPLGVFSHRGGPSFGHKLQSSQTLEMGLEDLMRYPVLSLHGNDEICSLFDPIDPEVMDSLFD
mmetsp:Transcript_15222/g.31386  ORF Transcript_15222/g.31386 Transcript_15222/m.31386 type:complete len:224 (-) Transcript_15222:148-819(-)